MEKKEIFKKVGKIIAELNEQYQYLSDKPENLNDLELELFLANSNFLTDHIEILRKLNGYSKPLMNIVHESQPAKSDPLVNSVINEEAGSGRKPESLAIDQKEQEVPRTEEVSNEVTDTKDEAKSEEEDSKINLENITPEVKPYPEQDLNEMDKRPAEEMVKEVVIPEKTINVETSVEPEETVSIPTINDIISAQVNSSTLANQFTSKPVADLKAIINLNDKLLFIKDLFNGYSLAYSEAIELLNRFDNFESADNFLKANYASKNNWSEKQSTVEKLYEILKRRFAK